MTDGQILKDYKVPYTCSYQNMIFVQSCTAQKWNFKASDTNILKNGKRDEKLYILSIHYKSQPQSYL